MSIEYLNAVFAVALTGVKKAVLIALADRANHSGYCYPGLDDIAFRAGCSKRSAIRAVEELEKLGFIAVIREIGKPNKYIFLPEKLYTTSDTVTPDKVIHRSDTTSPTHDTMSPNQCHSVTQTINNHHLTKEKRARGNKNQGHGIVTNSQAYKHHQATQGHKPSKQVIGREMKQIRALLIPTGAIQ